jgi:hypothetical protein
MFLLGSTPSRTRRHPSTRALNDPGCMTRLEPEKPYMPTRANASMYTSELLFLIAMAAMLLSCLIYSATQNFAFVSAGAGFASACCAFLAFLQVKNLTINLIRIQAHLSVVAYFFPLSYLGFIDNVGLLYASNDQLVAASIMIIISISIGWGFSFLVRLNASVPRDIPAFLHRGEIMLLVAPICLYQLYMMATGKWSYESTHPAFLGLGEPVSPLLIIAANTFGIGPMVAYNHGLLRPAERSWTQALVAIVVLTLGAAFWLIEGRRSLVTFALLSATAFFLGRDKGQISPRQILSMALVAVVLGVGLLQASKFFSSMRLAKELLGREQTLSMSIPEFLEYSSKIQAEAPPQEVIRDQVSRPFVIDIVAVMYQLVDHHMYGKELAMQIISVIPSAVFPGKSQFTADIGTMEDLWSKEYGIPLNDFANSFVLDGYLDFGYFGFLIYSLFAGICVKLLFRFYSISPSMACFCIFNSIALFVQVETSISASVVFLRDMMMLFVPLWIGFAIIEAGSRGIAPSKILLRKRP